MQQALFFAAAGLFGLLGAGVLSVVIAVPLRRKAEPLFPGGLGRLRVLIPAHQEATQVTGTIRSVQEAARQAGLAVSVVVGADSCSDGTARAAEEAGAEVRSVAYRSKWRTLGDLALLAKAGEWVALVDAGARWPAGLLAGIRAHLEEPSVLCVAPAYFPAAGSRLERMLWRFEAAWKEGENSAGGPLSVHGASVFFRAEVLQRAFRLAESKGTSWLNDDVVLPICVRMLHPAGEVRYWKPAGTAERVSDSGLREGRPQLRRRLRMAAGNLQWILFLWPALWRVNPGAALLGVRRFFRVFWAYWILCLLHSLCLVIVAEPGKALLFTGSAAVALAVILLLFGKGGLLEAAAVSLVSPLLLPFVLGRARMSWG